MAAFDLSFSDCQLRRKNVWRRCGTFSFPLHFLFYFLLFFHFNFIWPTRRLIIHQRLLRLRPTVHPLVNYRRETTA